jgi:hypothetical protein
VALNGGIQKEREICGVMSKRSGGALFSLAFVVAKKRPLFLSRFNILLFCGV